MESSSKSLGNWTLGETGHSLVHSSSVFETLGPVRYPCSASIFSST